MVTPRGCPRTRLKLLPSQPHPVRPPLVGALARAPNLRSRYHHTVRPPLVGALAHASNSYPRNHTVRPPLVGALAVTPPAPPLPSPSAPSILQRILRSSPTHICPCRILPVRPPFPTIIANILPNQTQLPLIPYYALIKIPLPQPPIIPLPPQLPHTPTILHSGHRLERANHFPKRRGTPCGCPLGCQGMTYKNNAMHMIRHNHKLVQTDERKPLRHPVPDPADHLPRAVQSHLPISHPAKQTQPALHHNRNKIRPGTRIIIPPEPDRPPTMNLRVITHVVTHPYHHPL